VSSREKSQEAPIGERNVSALRNKSLSHLGALLCGTTIGLAACSVDERQLDGLKVTIIPTAGYANGGEGGSTAGSAPSGSAGMASGGGGFGGGVGGNTGGAVGGGSGGTGATSATGGTDRFGGTGGAPSESGGSAGAGEPERCPDLDDNGVLDCDETILKNPAFDRDVESWSNDVDMDLAWEDADATGQDASGALGATSEFRLDQDGSKLLGARQCVPVAPARVYEFGAQIFVPEDAGETRATVQLLVYDGPSCSGDIVDNKMSSDLVGASPDWQPARLTYLTPTSAKSINLRLISIKLFREDPVTVLFDNVLVHQTAD
jgi:hypothetical protein